MRLTVKERILAIRLAESIERQSEYAKKIGIEVDDRIENKAEDNNHNKTKD